MIFKNTARLRSSSNSIKCFSTDSGISTNKVAKTEKSARVNELKMAPLRPTFEISEDKF